MKWSLPLLASTSLEHDIWLTFVQMKLNAHSNMTHGSDQKTLSRLAALLALSHLHSSLLFPVVVVLLGVRTYLQLKHKFLPVKSSFSAR